MDLRPFFRSWFYTYTLPEIKVSHFVERDEEGFLLKFHIVQRTEPFIFPLWVEWIEEGKAVRKMIVVDKKENSSEFRLLHKPRKINVNPDKAVPGKFQ